MSSKKGVAVLGATGTVGQKIIKLLEDHPEFEVVELVASQRSTGQVYGEKVHWREEGEIPKAVAKLKIISYKDVSAPYALSSIPSEHAHEVEGSLLKKGTHVISNTSAFRMETNVPLVVPEINRSHFSLVSQQQTPGKIITNPNCSTVFLALGLVPVFKKYTIEDLSVFTLQAISGAGYPGVASSDILGNTIPNIGGEEAKIQKEVLKILGEENKSAHFPVLANVNRVPVDHGHSITFHATLAEKVTADEIWKLYDSWESEFPGAFKVHRDDFKPQPKFALHSRDNRTHIGRIRVSDCGKKLSVISMGHNLIRGAAGAAILNLQEFHQYLENQA